MDRLRNAAILTRLVSEMREQGSWCGETHIQKAVYLMQELLDVPLDFEYTLYKHGPFSFDLRDELTALRGDEYFKLEAMPIPYGPKLQVKERADYIQKKFPRTLGRNEQFIDFIAETAADRGVDELEGLATALYVTRNLGTDHESERAEELHRLKPHISEDRAQVFVDEIDDIIVQAEKLT